MATYRIIHCIPEAQCDENNDGVPSPLSATETTMEKHKDAYSVDLLTTQIQTQT